MHFVDIQRIYFARRGQASSVFGLDSLAGRLRAVRPFKGRADYCVGECRAGASEVGLVASLRRAGAFFAVFGRRMANAAGSDDKAGASPAGRAFFGRIRRIGRMVWNGCWVVNWEGGKTRVSWRWGE